MGQAGPAVPQIRRAFMPAESDQVGEPLPVVSAEVVSSVPVLGSGHPSMALPAPPSPPPLLPPPTGPGSAPADAAAHADAQRLEHALDRLQMLGDRLAAEARADAVEVALLVARKIVEGELEVNVDRFLAMVRSAVRRLGESRRVVIRLAPADAEVVESMRQRNGGELAGFSSIQMEITADPTLKRGDVVVEGDLVAIDGRLDTRMAEMRRALAEQAMEETT